MTNFFDVRGYKIGPAYQQPPEELSVISSSIFYSKKSKQKKNLVTRPGRNVLAGVDGKFVSRLQAGLQEGLLCGLKLLV